MAVLPQNIVWSQCLWNWAAVITKCSVSARLPILVCFYSIVKHRRSLRRAAYTKSHIYRAPSHSLHSPSLSFTWHHCKVFLTHRVQWLHAGRGFSTTALPLQSHFVAVRFDVWGVLAGEALIQHSRNCCLLAGCSWLHPPQFHKWILEVSL